MIESPFLKIAADVLQTMPKQQAHVDEIARSAISRNMNMELDFETLKTKINSALSSTVKRKSGSQFSRVLSKGGKEKVGPFRKGLYRLKKIRTKKPSPPILVITDKAFLAKGGEYAVASELMFREFNVSIMVVDKGVDLVAEKNNKYFNIQVKTASNNGNSWVFTIKNDSFVTNLNGQTHYALVARDESSNIFFIIPSVQIKTYLDTGVLYSNSKSTTINLKISRAADRKNWFLGNNNLNHFMGAFHIIQ